MRCVGDHIKLRGEDWDIDHGNGTINNKKITMARYSRATRTWEKTDGWRTVEAPSWQEFMKDIEIAVRD